MRRSAKAREIVALAMALWCSQLEEHSKRGRGGAPILARCGGGEAHQRTALQLDALGGDCWPPVRGGGSFHVSCPHRAWRPGQERH
ncbi:hypothetical protein NDU88_005895 [Pleurodeles waltl]|uniref:Secreted protein n=1 Tax=Pleurodeles waltl TaxID=8319 RepID=A0AAV7MZR0_PLEWA|nr:hypothetical protein NDU88_005895 [Pleurodeles waltl]